MNTVPTRTMQFAPVNVTVTYDQQKNKLNISCDKPILTIGSDTLILYQLVSAPAGVRLWGLNISPSQQTQFPPPVVGAGGLLLTLQDFDTVTVMEDFEITLLVTNPFGATVDFDPQVINRPGL